MLNRSASLAMSTSVLKALPGSVLKTLPGKLDIKRHSPVFSIYPKTQTNAAPYALIMHVQLLTQGVCMSGHWLQPNTPCTAVYVVLCH